MKREALKAYTSWIISKDEYDQIIDDIKIQQEQHELNKNKTTAWTLTTDATTTLFTGTVNLILWNLSPFKKRK